MWPCMLNKDWFEIKEGDFLRVYLHWDLSILCQISLVAYQPYDSGSWDVLFLKLFEPHLSSDKCFLLRHKDTIWHKHQPRSDKISYFHGVCSFYPFADIVDQERSVGSSVVKWGDTMVFFLPCRVPYLKSKSDVIQMYHPGQVGTWGGKTAQWHQRGFICSLLSL